jgi:carboxymethylenebutenolidase
LQTPQRNHQFFRFPIDPGEFLWSAATYFSNPARTGDIAMCFDKGCESNDVNRRSFMIGGATAIAGLTALTTNGAVQEEEPPPTRVLDEPGIQHGKVTFPSGDEEIDGFLALPKAEGKYPAVLVIAGNRITEEYIPNTCAALAVAGYVALAPNIFHTVPDSATTPDEITKALEGRTDDDFLNDIRAGAEYLKRHDSVNEGGMGIIGFCSGGRRALLYADRFDDIKAVVPFHPARTTPEEVARLKAPVQIHSGTADRHIPVAQIRELDKVLRAQGTTVELYLYGEADHGFLAYTRPFYKPDAAQAAWKRTVEFLDSQLKQ